MTIKSLQRLFHHSPSDHVPDQGLGKLEPLRLLSIFCLLSGSLLSISENWFFALGALLLILGIGVGMFAELE